MNIDRNRVMGLLDSILQSNTSQSGMGRQLGMALLGYLASREGMGGGQAGAGRGGLGGFPEQLMGGQTPPPNQMNTAASGGLGALLQRFEQNGHGNIVNSWIGRGQNQPISPDQLHEALGPQTVNDLSQQTGMPRNDLLSQLAQALPELVDRLTPQGRIPNQEELSGQQQNRP